MIGFLFGLFIGVNFAICYLASIHNKYNKIILRSSYSRFCEDNNVYLKLPVPTYRTYGILSDTNCCVSFTKKIPFQTKTESLFEGIKELNNRIEATKLVNEQMETKIANIHNKVDKIVKRPRPPSGGKLKAYPQ